MPKKEIISTDRVTSGSAPLSQAVRFGNLVFVQGCTGRHPTSDHVSEGIKEQTRHALTADRRHPGGGWLVPRPSAYQHLLRDQPGRTCRASTRFTPSSSLRAARHEPR